MHLSFAAFRGNPHTFLVIRISKQTWYIYRFSHFGATLVHLSFVAFRGHSGFSVASLISGRSLTRLSFSASQGIGTITAMPILHLHKIVNPIIPDSLTCDAHLNH